jgi:hypothetical protein
LLHSVSDTWQQQSFLLDTELIREGYYVIRNIASLRIWYLIGGHTMDPFRPCLVPLTEALRRDDTKVHVLLFKNSSTSYVVVQFHISKDPFNPGAYLVKTDYGGRCATAGFNTSGMPTPYRFFPVWQGGTYFLYVFDLLQQLQRQNPDWNCSISSDLTSNPPEVATDYAQETTQGMVRAQTTHQIHSPYPLEQPIVPMDRSSRPQVWELIRVS